jgi:hypothetical protein
MTNECQCSTNFELVNGNCSCTNTAVTDTSFPCLTRNCPTLPSIGTLMRAVVLNPTYYQNNSSAVDQWVNECAMTYGLGEPELVQLCRTFNDLLRNNAICIATSCNASVIATSDFYMYSIYFYECLRCPPEANLIGTTCYCPANQVHVNSTCQCAPTFVRDSLTPSQCVCPANLYSNGTACVTATEVTSGSSICRIPGQFYNIITNQCQCSTNFQVSNGLCSCNSTNSYQTPFVCFTRNCPALPSIDLIINLVLRSPNYYQSNPSAVDQWVDACATTYGFGEPELVQLCRNFNDLLRNNANCIATSCNASVIATSNFYIYSIYFYECLRCPLEANLINNECNCPENKTLVNNSTCECAPTFVRDSSNPSQCVCPGNWSYNGTACVSSSQVGNSGPGSPSSESLSSETPSTEQSPSSIETPPSQSSSSGSLSASSGLPSSEAPLTETPPSNSPIQSPPSASEILSASSESVSSSSEQIQQPSAAPSSQSCPMFETLQNGTCHCSPGFTRDLNSGRCVCSSGYQLNNGTCVPLTTLSSYCVCPENEYYDYILKKCRCIAGYYRDPMTKHCLIECIYCGEFEVYNSTVEACVCAEGYVRLTPQANCTLP